MSVKVTFTRGDGSTSKLELSVGSETLVSEVAEQLFRADPSRVGMQMPAQLGVVVTPLSAGPDAAARALAAEAEFMAAGVRSGDHIEVVPAAAAAARGAVATGVAARAEIVAGPDRGKSFDLRAGSSIIGRDAGVAIRLKDNLASKRHARITVGEEIEVVDLGSTNGVMVGGEFITRAKLLPGDSVVIGDTEIEITRQASAATDIPTTPSIPFTRSPRVVPPLPDDEVELPKPPEKSQPRRFPGIALVAPVILGLSMYMMTGRLFSLIFVAMAPLMMIGTYVDSRAVAKREFKQQSQEFDEDLDLSKERIAVLQAQERVARFAMAPSVADVAQAARTQGTLLWTFRPEHEMFLTARLGVGSLPTSIDIKIPERGKAYPGFHERVLEVADGTALVHDVPVVADFRSVGNLGIAGDAARSRGLARSVVTQVVGLHSPLELAVTAFASPDSRAEWHWLSWLPHTTSPVSPVGVDHLTDSREGSAALLSALESVVEQRAGGDISGLVPEPRGFEDSDADAAPAEQPKVPAVLVIVEDDALADRNRLIRLAEKGPDVNVHIVWVAPNVSRVPAACRVFIDFEAGDGPGRAGLVRRGYSVQPIECEALSVDDARSIARQLSPVEDVATVVQDSGDIPRSVSYLELHGFDAVEPGTHEQRWKHDSASGKKRPFTLRALIGQGGDGPFYLDLRAQGPHALVGGTTGAGKSEFLQSWILGMAAAYGPDKVTFLFVDYKGGSAFADCINLPHSVGLVTDLTPHLVDRALTSLRAELHYRERLLQTKKAKDLETLEKAGDPDAPPSLVIVIDEFAALVQEVPDFVDGVVDIAQRGRSLGLHLILATQRPAGVIKDNLRANTNLRIALRMADEGDSTDILGVPSAAHVDPSLPGRAMARTGPGRLNTFQAAYAGANTSPDAGPPPIGMREVLMGTVGLWEPPKGPVSTADEGPSDAEAVVAAMKSAQGLAQLPDPRRPWLDDLKVTYELKDLTRGKGQSIALGVVDDPAHQRQEPLSFDPDKDGNLAVFGTSGTGKSTLLRSLALSATLTKDVAPVHVYAIDAAGGSLSVLETLPNVGAVIDVDDSERVGRLLRRLDSLVDERAGAYTEMHASSLTEYRRISGDRGHPRILLLIDGFGAFQNDYQNDSSRSATFAAFQSVIAKGRGFGVHVALSADRQGALHSSIQAQLSRVIAMRLVDENQYSLFGVSKNILSKDSPAGRAIDVASNREVQIAVYGGSSSVVDQAAAITELVQKFPDREEWVAPGVPSMPTELAGSEMPDNEGGKPVLGIESEGLVPIGFTLGRPFMVTGQAGSGRTTALRWLSESIARSNPKAKQILLSLRPTVAAEGKHWAAKAQSGADVVKLLEKHGPAFEDSAKPGEGWVVVIEAVNDFVGSVADQPLMQALKALKRGGHTVVAEAETTGWSSGMLTNEIKSARRGLILQPDPSEGPLLFGVAFPRLNRASMPPGRAVFVESGRASVVQLPLPSGE